jgi:hypothetical protein
MEDRVKWGNMADSQETYDRETERYAELSGHFKHYCPDWDFMAIDETCPEFSACLCYNRSPRAGAPPSSSR